MKKSVKDFYDSYNLVAYDSNSDSYSNPELSSNSSVGALSQFPRINAIVNDISDNENIKIPIEVTQSEISHRLTNLVRKQYFTYLENQLQKNYLTSVTGPHYNKISTQNIQKCAEQLEQKALRSCMIVSLYRKSILKCIAEIRRDTNQKKLHTHLTTEQLNKRGFHVDAQVQTDFIERLSEKTDIPIKLEQAIIKSKFMLKNKSFANVKVQTDFPYYGNQVQPLIKTEASIIELSLEDKIKKFELKLKEEDRKRKQFSNYLTKKKIEEEKKEKFAKKLRYCAPTSSPSFENAVLKIQPPCANNTVHPLPTTPPALLTPISNLNFSQTEDNIAKELQALFGPEDENNVDIFGESINNPQLDAIITEINQFTKPTMTQINEILPDNFVDMERSIETESINTDEVEPNVTVEQQLKDSLWPCELHMQRLRLRKILNEIADKGLRHSEKVRFKFILLFGEDDDDEMGPYSPSIELDEILMSSCKKRIAPWIVKYLMRPMNDGLIANRYLFKKLAKHIAEDVISQDQYPAERAIKIAVDDYFCAHPFVGTIKDIN